MKLGKYFLAFLFLFSCIDAWAADIAHFLYLGVSPVYSLTHFNWTEKSGQKLIDNTQGNTQAEVFGGYGLLVDRVYLGLEANTQFVNRTATNNTRDETTQQLFTDKMTMRDIYIADFRPGYVLNGKNTMLYGVFGVNSANFKATQEDVNGDIVQETNTQRELGMRFGIGYNLGLGHHLMARVEYVYTQFPNFDSANFNFHPNSSEFSIGLSTVLVL
jgi:opacity protein-like surface antigen